MWRGRGRSVAGPLALSLLGAFAVGCGADASGEPTTDAAALQPVTGNSAPTQPASGAPARAAADVEIHNSEPDSADLASYPPVSVPAPDPTLAPDAGAASPSPVPDAVLVTQRPLLPPAPAEVVVPPGDCRFEYLGKWVRCENAGWPNVIATDAPDLLSCMQQCLEREDCTAVTDYRWLGLPDIGCYLYVSSCDEPFSPDFGEEDGGRDFRRVCSPPSP